MIGRYLLQTRDVRNLRSLAVQVRERGTRNHIVKRIEARIGRELGLGAGGCWWCWRIPDRLAFICLGVALSKKMNSFLNEIIVAGSLVHLKGANHRRLADIQVSWYDSQPRFATQK